MDQNLFKDYGMGVGIRSPHYHLFDDGKPKSIHWGEVISENFMQWEDGFTPNMRKRLEGFRKNLPIALHGVSMNICSADELDTSYLRRLKDLAKIINPMWISDHLCWTGVGQTNTHDLLPVPFTQENLNFISEKIQKIQNFLGQRILIENVSSYFEYESSEMTEWEFLSELLKKADCGILLDVNNVFVSSVNHNFNPTDYLKKIPKERVGQIHLAGHTVRNGYLVDTHDEDVRPEVWELYRWVSQNMGLYSTMIERDDNIPEWEILEKELTMAQKIRDEVIIGKTTPIATTVL